jgi:hypothetical protein
VPTWTIADHINNPRDTAKLERITMNTIKLLMNSMALISMLLETTSARRSKCGTEVHSNPKDPILPHSAHLMRRQNVHNKFQPKPLKVNVQTHVITGGGPKVNAFNKESTEVWKRNLNEAFASVGISFEFRETKFHQDEDLSSKFNVFEDPLGIIDFESPELLQIVVAEEIFNPNMDPDDILYGKSNFPWNTRKDTHLDFVRMAAFAMPPADSATLAHEVGHWFGLYHTFAFGCPIVKPNALNTSHHGDYVKDTLTGKKIFEKFNGQQCHALNIPDSTLCTMSGKSTPEPYPVDNFMSYTPARCQNKFTPGQGARMHAMWSWRTKGAGPKFNTLY